MSNPTDDGTTKSAWPRAAIFDFDGTLADTTSRWTAAYQDCLRRRGRTADEPTLRALAGASVPDAARALDIPPDELTAALAGAFRAQPLTEMPGATALVRALCPRTRLAIASNGPAALVRLGLDQLGLRPYFDAIVSGEETGSFKPAPGVYLHAAAEVGLRPRGLRRDRGLSSRYTGRQRRRPARDLHLRKRPRPRRRRPPRTAAGRY